MSPKRTIDESDQSSKEGKGSMSIVPEYKITALRLGTLEVPKAAMTYFSGFDRTIVIPVWAAAVELGGLKILVDTGIANHDKWDRELGPCWRQEDESIESALAEIGWRLKDVDYVINSHLHYDHAENNTLFKSSQFIVSRSEWEYAKDPIPSQRKLYDFEWTDEAVTYMDYQLISVDDYDIMSGIRLIQTPGHSRGHQSVLVNTAEGVVCIAGDAACLPESFTGPNPPGGATSIEQGFNSLERIRNSSQRVFMNHDPNIQKFQSDGFLLVPQIGDDPHNYGIDTLSPRITHHHH